MPGNGQLLSGRRESWKTLATLGKKLALTGSQEYPDFTTVVAPKSTKGGVTLVHLILRTRVFRGFEEKGALPFPGKIRGAEDANLRSHCPVQIFGNG